MRLVGIVNAQWGERTMVCQSLRARLSRHRASSVLRSLDKAIQQESRTGNRGEALREGWFVSESWGPSCRCVNSIGDQADPDPKEPRSVVL